MKKSELKALINEVIQEMDQSDPQRAAALSDREHRRAQKLVEEVLREQHAGQEWEEAWDNGDGTFSLVWYMDDSVEGRRPGDMKTVKPNDPSLTPQEKNLIKKSQGGSRNVQNMSKLNNWLSNNNGENALKIVDRFNRSDKLKNDKVAQLIVAHLTEKLDSDETNLINLFNVRAYEKDIISAMAKLVSLKDPSLGAKLLKFFGFGKK